METAALALDVKAILGEGPSWHAELKLLLWVDILGQKVHLYDPAAVTDRVLELDQPVGAVVPRESGGAIIAAKQGFYTLNLDSGLTEPITDPEAHLTDNRFNDGKCDPAGRFWAGTMLNRDVAAGSLYCLETDLTCRKVLDQVRISNGIGWSPDHRTMYYNDTPTRKVVAFDYNVSSGEISNKRIAIDYPERGHGNPDGMTVDAEGMLWIAEWNGWQVSRWNPHNGKLLDTVPVPVARVTSCVFGGERLDELYITTASVDLTEEEKPNQPLAGGVFTVKPGVKGAPTYTFGG